MRSVAVLSAGCLSLVMLAACGFPGGGSRAPVSARCSPASASLLAKIMDRVDVRPGGMLSSGYAVQSTDFGERVWRGPIMMVAAEIDGAGFEGTGDIGVWATAELKPNAWGPSRPGHYGIYAVNELARQLSWSDDSAQDEFPISADGVAEALACTQAG